MPDPIKRASPLQNNTWTNSFLESINMRRVSLKSLNLQKNCRHFEHELSADTINIHFAS